MSTVVERQISGRYARLMTSLLRGTLRLDVWVNRLYPTDFNPLYYTGGLSNLFLFTLVLSGIFLFFYYDASLGEAFASVQYITDGVPYGGIVRGVHRYAADGFIVGILLHLLRNWFTDRHLFARDNPWISGMFLLLFAGFIGFTGYQLVWDERAQLLTSMFVAMLRSIPARGQPHQISNGRFLLDPVLAPQLPPGRGRRALAGRPLRGGARHSVRQPS